MIFCFSRLKISTNGCASFQKVCVWVRATFLATCRTITGDWTLLNWCAVTTAPIRTSLCTIVTWNPTSDLDLGHILTSTVTSLLYSLPPRVVAVPAVAVQHALFKLLRFFCLFSIMTLSSFLFSTMTSSVCCDVVVNDVMIVCE